MRLYDTHCHLQDERLAPCRDAVLARAREAGVRALLVCGSEEADWEGVATLAATVPEVVPAFGLHPWYVARRTPAWLDRLAALAEAHPTATVGEIGLDHALEPSTWQEQERVLLAQVDLARRLGRPVSLHCRKAWGRLVELLRAGVLPPPAGAAVHAYSGPPDLVAELTGRGLCLSFGGGLTRSGSKRARRAVVAVPANRLLLETDAPDIPGEVPPGVPREQTDDGTPLSEPAHVVCAAHVAAELRGEPVEGLAERTYLNAVRLFGAPTAAAPLPNRQARR